MGNYDYIEIYYLKNTYWFMTKFYYTSGAQIPLNIYYAGDGTTQQFQSKVMKLAGVKVLTHVHTAGLNFWDVSALNTFTNNGNEIPVYKIIGYKY